MKIFISHSARDKWVARRISEDLIKLGAKTFLDEKDIETGASIDDMIGNHLKDCSDCLILLSPTALGSHWVLVEIGGAKALGKRIIPILLHIGANEMPAPISKHLARDINDIEKYYDEVRQRLEGKSIPERGPTRRGAVPSRKRPLRFKVGDEVRIISSPKLAAEREEIKWVKQMTRYSGKTAVVTEVDPDPDVHRVVVLDIDGGQFYWAFEWLTKA